MIMCDIPKKSLTRGYTLQRTNKPRDDTIKSVHTGAIYNRSMVHKHLVFYTHSYHH